MGQVFGLGAGRTRLGGLELRTGAQLLHVARVAFDVAALGGAAAGRYHLRVLLPAGAILIGGVLHIDTPFTGQGTIALGVVEAGDLVAAADVTQEPYATVGLKAIRPRLDTPETTAVVLNQPSPIVVTVSDTLVTGACTLHVQYVRGEPAPVPVLTGLVIDPLIADDCTLAVTLQYDRVVAISGDPSAVWFTVPSAPNYGGASVTLVTAGEASALRFEADLSLDGYGGETFTVSDLTADRQHWAQLTDAVSGMPVPDTFGDLVATGTVPWPAAVCLLRRSPATVVAADPSVVGVEVWFNRPLTYVENPGSDLTTDIRCDGSYAPLSALTLPVVIADCDFDVTDPAAPGRARVVFRTTDNLQGMGGYAFHLDNDSDVSTWRYSLFDQESGVPIDTLSGHTLDWPVAFPQSDQVAALVQMTAPATLGAFPADLWAQVSVTLTYDRDVRITGDAPMTLQMVSSNPARLPHVTLPIDPNTSAVGLATKTLIFKTPVNLTNADGVTLTCSNASVRTGFDQVIDTDSGHPVANDLGAFTAVTTITPAHPPVLLGIYMSAPHAVNGGLSVQLWYDRPLKNVGPAAVTLTLVASDLGRFPTGITLPLYNDPDALNNAPPQPGLPGVPAGTTGRANVIFQGTADLTGCAGMSLTCSNASPRTGFDQLLDVYTNVPVPASFGAMSVTVVVQP